MQDSRKSSLHCNYCKKPGHLIDKCYKLHGFSADFKFNKPKRFAAQVAVTDGSVSSNSFNTGLKGNTPNNVASTSSRNAGGLSPELYSVDVIA